MFEVIEQFLIQFVDCIPYLIGLWLIFAFIGDLLFGGKR